MVSRQSKRSTFWPCSAADSSAMSHSPRRLDWPDDGSLGTVMVNTDAPYLPASMTPAGDCTDATEIGMCGFWNGLIWSIASFSSNQSLL